MTVANSTVISHLASIFEWVETYYIKMAVKTQKMKTLKEKLLILKCDYLTCNFILFKWSSATATNRGNLRLKQVNPTS